MQIKGRMGLVAYRRAFTRTELVVVIVIVVLLLTILALVLNLTLNTGKDDSEHRDRNSNSIANIWGTVKHTHCKVNLNSLSKSMLGYAAQNNDEYPSKSLSGQTTQAGVLMHFAWDQGVSGEMFLCPAATDDKAIVPAENPTEVVDGQYGSYSYQDCGDEDRKVTYETKSDVVFLADKKNPGDTKVSRNHNSGEFMFYASKSGAYRSPVDDDITTLNDATFGRAGNNIFFLDRLSPDADYTRWTPRDDSYLLEVDK